MFKIITTAWFVFIVTTAADAAGKPIIHKNYDNDLWLSAIMWIGFSILLGYMCAKENR